MGGRRILLGAATLAVALAGITRLRTAGVAGSAAPASDAEPIAPAESASRPPSRARPTLTPEELSLVEGLLARLRGPISHPRARMRLVQELVRFLKARHPETWRAELERVLRLGFPDDADALLRLWEAHEGFAAWWSAEQQTLARLPAGERRQRLWEARRRFFGADAEALFERALQSEALAATLRQLDERPSGTVGERFDTFLGAVGNELGEQAPAFVAAHQQELLDRFLALPSVQDELAALAPGERHAAMRALREGLGMDDEALARWDELDRTRELRWQVGRAYMAERETLMRTLAGAELERALASLRERTFGAEAEIIASEEAQGYLRFAGARTYGRN